MYDTILIPIGGGVYSDRSVETGLSLATAYGASVHVLRLIDTDWRRTCENVSDSHLLVGGLRGSGNQSPDSRVDDRRANAWAAARRAMREANESGVDTVNRVVYGRSHEIIAAYASDYDVDLVVMSERERSNFGWLRRSFSTEIVDRVAAGTVVPVLVVGGDGGT